MQVGEAAGRVHVPEFRPRAGVQIETDPKATAASKATALGDDEGAIAAHIAKLEVLPRPLLSIPLPFSLCKIVLLGGSCRSAWVSEVLGVHSTCHNQHSSGQEQRP